MVEADITMKTLNLNGKKIAYDVEYMFNSIILKVYIKHRRGQSAKSNKLHFIDYADYSRSEIVINTKNYCYLQDALNDFFKDLKVDLYIKKLDPKDKLFIKEIYKALE